MLSLPELLLLGAGIWWMQCSAHSAGSVARRVSCGAVSYRVVSCCIWLPKLLPLPLENNTLFFPPKIVPVGVVVRFRCVFAENLSQTSKFLA